jgi:hypothetical protein
MTRQAFRHSSPEHWRARSKFRAARGYDVENVLEPGQYEVVPGDDGEPIVVLRVAAYRRLRELIDDPGDLAYLDQMIAHLDAENARIAQEVSDGQ